MNGCEQHYRRSVVVSEVRSCEEEKEGHMLTYICRLERRVAVVAAAVAGTAVEVVAVTAKAPDKGARTAVRMSKQVDMVAVPVALRC